MSGQVEAEALKEPRTAPGLARVRGVEGDAAAVSGGGEVRAEVFGGQVAD